MPDGDEVELSGLPETVDATHAEVSVDPPPKLLRRHEGGAIGSLYQLQAAHDLAEAATDGSPGARSRAHRLIGFAALVLLILPALIMLVDLLI